MRENRFPFDGPSEEKEDTDVEESSRPVDHSGFRSADILIVTCVPGGPLEAQECPGVMGYQSFGDHNQDPNDIVVVGQSAITADLHGLTVYAIGDPAHITRTGTVLLPDTGAKVAVEGHLACVALGRSGFAVVDLSDPSNPVVLAVRATDTYAYSIAMTGDVAFVGTSTGLELFDLSVPADPEALGAIAAGAAVYDMEIANGFLYGAVNTGGLVIFDLSTVGSPALVGTLERPGAGRSVEVLGMRVYLGDDDPGLDIIDVSQATNPVLIGSYTTSGSGRTVTVSGQTAYVGESGVGIEIVDITNPATPTLLGSYQGEGSSISVAFSGGVLYSTDIWGDGLLAIDVSDPADPELAGIFDTSGKAMAISLSGGIAAVADGPWGLRLIDVSEPATVPLLGGLVLPGRAYGLDLEGDTAYVAAYRYGLQVVDVSDPGQPELLGSYDTAGFASDVVVVSDIAYVADEREGLEIIDVSDPEHPELLAHYDTPGSAQSVVVVGGRAYIADWGGGLQIVDVSNPSSPTFLGSLESLGWTKDVAVSGNVAYVAVGYGGLKVIDVSDPANPALVGAYSAGGWATTVAVSGHQAFLGGSVGGLHVLDVSDPSSPSLISLVPVRHSIQNIELAPDTGTVWMAEGALVDSLNLHCGSCAGLGLTADPSTIPAGGQTSTITVAVADAFGQPVAGAAVAVSTTLGTVSGVTDHGDGRYTATLTSGARSGRAVVTVSVGGFPCDATTTVEVTGGDEGTGSWIPVAVHGAGANGSEWRTAVGILGVGSAGDSLTVRLHQAGETTERTVSIGKGQQLLLQDVLGWLGENGAGALEVLGSQPFVLTSRTYSERGSGDPCFGGGTTGQFLAASDRAVVLHAGNRAWLPQLIENPSFRTNIALSNVGESTARARVTLHTGDGLVVGTYDVILDPGEWKQDNGPYSNRFDVSDMEAGYAAVEILAGDAVTGYASVVDNVTNDPTTIPVATP